MPCQSRHREEQGAPTGVRLWWAPAAAGHRGVSADESFYFAELFSSGFVPRWHCAMVVPEGTRGCRAGSWAKGGQQAGKDTAGRVGTWT